MTLRTNPEQISAFQFAGRFLYLVCGRRGGKTFTLKERILKKAETQPAHSDIYYIGPTNSQAKELIWDELEKRLYELDWWYRPLVSKSRFELSNGRMIYVIGAEKISRIRGHKVWHLCLDELAYFNTDFTDVWRAARPTLTDLGGTADLATTPDGKGSQAYDVWMQAIEKPEWQTYCWKTIDNPWIDPKEIEDAKSELDDYSFRQEYEATWELYEGLAYYNMSENDNIATCDKIEFQVPLQLCFDFNVNPTSLLCVQRIGNKLFVRKEYSEANSSTEKTVQHFCEEHMQHRDRLEIQIRGDAAGKARNSATGRSDYQYVEEVLQHNGFRYSYEVPARNPPIIDRIKYVNGWLKPMTGDTRIIVDPSCKDLIRDLTSQGLDGRVPSKKNNLGHKADALGYTVYWEHITGNRQSQRTIEL